MCTRSFLTLDFGRVISSMITPVDVFKESKMRLTDEQAEKINAKNSWIVDKAEVTAELAARRPEGTFTNEVCEECIAS